ncbi:MAG: biopolymer transporter ExbD [Acidobacteria bacterium]|nr:MAG: biopolymer transporter ExbD [Acidobacteriota bacterium]PYS64315.1 MAG: biopolymer transporter ExbD [Acidobacteriota bacterium]
MGMSAGGGGGLQSEINVTPMVDVMLVLLIIFMVVTPFLQQGVTVAIPRDMKNPDEDQAITKETSVIVSITCPTNRPQCRPEETEYYLGKKKVNLDDLKSQVEKSLANKKEEDKIVYIKSGVEVSYGEVVKVINAVREKGVDKIGLVADKLKKGVTAAPPAT